MNTVQTKWGINNVIVGTLSITTVKLKVKGSFPVHALPEEVKYYMTSKGVYIIKYEGLSSQSRNTVARVVDVLASHARMQMEQKYARMRNPLAYDMMVMEAEYAQYQNSQMFDWAEDAEL
jgi:hypothetical protein